MKPEDQIEFARDAVRRKIKRFENILAKEYDCLQREVLEAKIDTMKEIEVLLYRWLIQKLKEADSKEELRRY